MTTNSYRNAAHQNREYAARLVGKYGWSTHDVWCEWPDVWNLDHDTGRLSLTHDVHTHGLTMTWPERAHIAPCGTCGSREHDGYCGCGA